MVRRRKQLAAASIVLMLVSLGVFGFMKLQDRSSNDQLPPQLSATVSNKGISQPEVVKSSPQAAIHSQLQSAITNYCITSFANTIKPLYPDKQLVNKQFRAADVSFKTNVNSAQDGNYARLEANCSTPQINRSEQKWSSFVALLSKTNDTWRVNSAGRPTPDCTDVDGLHYPATVVPACLDTKNRQRTPQ